MARAAAPRTVPRERRATHESGIRLSDGRHSPTHGDSLSCGGHTRATAAHAAEARYPATRTAAILKHPPRGFAEQMQYGMIGYVVPRKVYPPGYHRDARQPLPFAALASRKNCTALYLMTTHQGPEMERWFRRERAKK